jgi:hypothetical protein
MHGKFPDFVLARDRWERVKGRVARLQSHLGIV